MGAFFAWVGSFLGALLDKVLPTIIREAKKPKEAKVIGADTELLDAVDASIIDEINNAPPLEPRAGVDGPNPMREDYLGALGKMFPEGLVIVHRQGDRWMVYMNDDNTNNLDARVINLVAEHLNRVMPDLLEDAEGGA